MSMNSRAWLAQVEEEILEPELKICDPHHHLWDYPHHRYMLEDVVADLGLMRSGQRWILSPGPLTSLQRIRL